MTTVAFAKSAPALIRKGKLGVYFAWGAFAKRDGELFVDAHGDDIPGDEFVGAALSLAKSAKLGHEHDGTVNGSVPLVFPLTEDIQAALELTSPHAGLAVGFQPVGDIAASLEAGDQWELSIAGEAMAELIKTTIAKSDKPDDIAKAKQRRTLTKLRIDEISLVKAGAHGAGTRIAIAKRGEPIDQVVVVDMVKAIADADPIAKRAPAMTDATGGHQHLIFDAEEPDGFTSYEVAPGAEYGHSHPFVRLADGSISIGEAAGHTHAISTEQATMADDLAKTLAADVAKARGMIATAISLPPEQVAYAKRLTGDALEAYVAKSAEDRAKLSAPIHKSERTGRVFFAGDEPLVDLAKDADATHAELAKARDEAAATIIAKSAAAIPHVKGAALLAKAVHGVALTVEERTEALAALATIDASIATVTQPIGKGAEAGANGPDAELTALAKSIQAGVPGMSFAKAYDEALQTERGAALYAQTSAR